MNFWILFGLIAALSGMLLSGIVMMIKNAVTKAKPWLHLVDEEGGVGSLARRKLKDGFFIVGRGDDQKRYPITATARSVTANNGVIYTLGKQTGINLRPPTRKDITTSLATKAELEAFETVDPLLLARTFARRIAQETIDSQTEKEDWKKTAILPLSIVCGLLVIGFIVVAARLAG